MWRTHLASVLNAGEEVEDLLFLAHDALLLLVAVGDALGLENRIPIFVGDFDLVFDGCVVFELGLLRHADELLDVVPLAFEQCGVIRNWVIRAVGCGNTCQHGELARLGAHSALSVIAGDASEANGEVTPRRVDVEQVYYLNVLRACHGLAPVGIKD